MSHPDPTIGQIVEYEPTADDERLHPRGTVYQEPEDHRNGEPIDVGYHEDGTRVLHERIHAILYR